MRQSQEFSRYTSVFTHAQKTELIRSVMSDFDCLEKPLDAKGMPEPMRARILALLGVKLTSCYPFLRYATRPADILALFKRVEEQHLRCELKDQKSKKPKKASKRRRTSARDYSQADLATTVRKFTMAAPLTQKFYFAMSDNLGDLALRTVLTDILEKKKSTADAWKFSQQVRHTLDIETLMWPYLEVENSEEAVLKYPYFSTQTLSDMVRGVSGKLLASRSKEDRRLYKTRDEEVRFIVQLFAFVNHHSVE